MLYNSIKKYDNEFKVNIPDYKRPLKDGDFAKASHSVIESFNYDEDEFSDEQDVKLSTSKTKAQQYNVYYEPKTSINDQTDRSRQKQERIEDRSDFRQIRSGEPDKINQNDPNRNYRQYNNQELKIPKAAKAVTNRKANSKFSNTNTFVEKTISNPFASDMLVQGNKHSSYQISRLILSRC